MVMSMGDKRWQINLFFFKKQQVLLLPKDSFKRLCFDSIPVVLQLYSCTGIYFCFGLDQIFVLIYSDCWSASVYADSQKLYCDVWVFCRNPVLIVLLISFEKTFWRFLQKCLNLRKWKCLYFQFCTSFVSKQKFYLFTLPVLLLQ